jgi:Zn-dependent M28 family amino/carboxypeptidase
MSYNTIAEIPGTDRKDEVVMLGAHLDSWHAGTGATDNGVGAAVCMEVTRILKALNVNPRRTIRIALWSGEEQDLKGSRAYVRQHFGSRPEPTDPEENALPDHLQSYQGPLSLKPEHAKLSVYFNFDNGSGKIRGIFLQGNAAARPIFEEWLKPFVDLGVNTVSIRDTFGTDHLSFDEVGLPGFQFVQDGLEYGRTHHSNIDVVDYAQPDDLMQASVVIASLVYQAAMRDEMIPRKPLPPDHPVEEKKPVTVEVPPPRSGSR